MNRAFCLAFVVSLAAVPAMAAEPDGLILPPGFHATVVAEGVGAIRHLAVRGNDIYVSTRHGANQPSAGILAIRMGADHKAAQIEHFAPGIDRGTGIRIYNGYLYAATSTGVARIKLDDNLIPAAQPEMIVDGLAATNHPLAFDGRGNMYVSVDGGGGADNCWDPKGPKDKPVGLKPCPILETRGGIWRFSDSKPDQKFADGEHFATGLRNQSAMDWRQGDGLYGAWHGRDSTFKGWPELVSAEQDDAIADEMFRIGDGTDMGWPYTYYDGLRKIRFAAPEYGGDGKTPVTDGKYATPVAVFAPKRPAVLDMAFYNGSKFPSSYRRGAFVAMHGGGVDGTVLPGGHAGYDIMFVPFTGNRAGTPVVFADGFAGPGPGTKNVPTAAYRPVGVAVGGDGALYVADSVKGRIWRIAYE